MWLWFINNQPFLFNGCSKAEIKHTFIRGACVRRVFIPPNQQPDTFLTHCGVLTPCGDTNLCQPWPRQWLVAWRHQAITWPNVDWPSVRSCGINLTTISQEMLIISILDNISKITNSGSQPHVLGANELKRLSTLTKEKNENLATHRPPIPLTKSQQCGKRVLVIMSSCDTCRGAPHEIYTLFSSVVFFVILYRGFHLNYLLMFFAVTGQCYKDKKYQFIWGNRQIPKPSKSIKH